VKRVRGQRNCGLMTMREGEAGAPTTQYEGGRGSSSTGMLSSLRNDAKRGKGSEAEDVKERAKRRGRCSFRRLAFLPFQSTEQQQGQHVALSQSRRPQNEEETKMWSFLLLENERIPPSPNPNPHPSLQQTYKSVSYSSHSSPPSHPPQTTSSVPPYRPPLPSPHFPQPSLLPPSRAQRYRGTPA
jgi:hypothetical protein